MKTVLTTANKESLVSHLVPIGKITFPQSQLRRYFESTAMQALVESVKKEGILQPILVRPVGENYELVAGHRRFKAAQLADLAEVPVTVREMTEKQAVQYALIENLQRQDLNPIEQTEGILELLAISLGCSAAGAKSLLHRMQNEVKGKTPQNVMGKPEAETVKWVFESLGLMSWESFVTNRLPLLNLPSDILEVLRSGRLEYTKAREIAKIKSESERQALLSEALALELSLGEIRQRVKALLPPKERSQLLARLEATYKKASKSKVWENSEKCQQLDSLLAQIDRLLSEGE